MSHHPNVHIVGAGLAGSEAALLLAHHQINVTLYEMRPQTMTPAHTGGDFCELLCSNSLRGESEESGPGILKRELLQAGSPFMQVATKYRVPAGGAFAVDRHGLSSHITKLIEEHPRISTVRKEYTAIDSGHFPLILAPGPLASVALCHSLEPSFGQGLYFYDAIAPIVDGDSIDMSKAFRAARYNKGEPDYLNCPMNKQEYEAFYRALSTAQRVKTRDFEKTIHFEGCMPIEEMADRGEDTLRFGPMKPVGLNHPVSGESFHAVVQLRRESLNNYAWNMVGFQTKLTHSEQKRVLRLIPGLEQASFMRLGSMHRNTYIESPRFLDPSFRVKDQAGLFIAGQITGVEGYIESVASGHIAALAALHQLQSLPFAPPPPTTAMGALCAHISTPSKNFTPSNIHFGLFSPLTQRHRKKERKSLYSSRAQTDFKAWIRQHQGSLSI
ncbi:methylenetetrahydrofolate--tRNA-(uracil(54)-C(5))-methyltransferase (FADH(2)-oxidizing) TrmFO [Desulfurispira natronophila]|uniref:Methylenetetrahydrofolate--tRNA-(uracil-5-)-methyltransferase TrmFO n=1 Tax=Desulfurispira natronophila TaxID=682562 RepID=A0A7W7Y3L9_9BACT|nr:methylenetetrahydrofolate--tRNA-(uracil(54)-C(5))-methyltransferase (FADH(2)-oxidizing) TrmFO [Desulfurispira natronophila]MBB5021442.1 methylenetetrahydrofolate--tRNA-(uracil-5-)-methyltransferase [Desulfurispira natronophila]